VLELSSLVQGSGSDPFCTMASPQPLNSRMRFRTWRKTSRISQANLSSLVAIRWSASLSRQDPSSCIHWLRAKQRQWRSDAFAPWHLLQELLGHCTGMYDSNRQGILRLEAHLKQYGYANQQGLQHPENPLEASRF
jgi:hypothetical protein